MRSKKKKAPGAYGCVAVACALPALSFGQGVEETFTWALDLGVEYTDNVGRAAADEESETVGIAGLALGLITDRPRIDASIFADVEYHEYLDDAFESELVGGLDGLVSYAFIPERLHWMVADNFGQISNERTLVDTPTNRQNVNYFTTGPDITLPIGTRTSLLLAGRFSDTYYENTLEGSQSLGGSVALMRRLSDVSNVSLNGSTTEIQYDEEQLFGDYRLDQAFLRWAVETERTTLSIDGGYTIVDQDGESSDGLLARLEFSRAVAARSRIGIRAGTEFATSGEAFRRDQSVTGIETGNDDAIAASDPYQLDYAYLTWSTDWERGGFTAVLNARSESHEIETDADRDLYGASISVSRELSRRLDAYVTARYSEEEFVNEAFTFDEWGVGVGLNWLLGARLSMILRLDHFEGSSDDGTRDFDENRAYIGIAYGRAGS